MYPACGLERCRSNSTGSRPVDENWDFVAPLGMSRRFDYEDCQGLTPGHGVFHDFYFNPAACRKCSGGGILAAGGEIHE